MILEIETALERKIQQLLDSENVKVAAFPDDLRASNQPACLANVLVGYKKTTFRDLETNPLHPEKPLTEYLLQFDINIEVKGLRTHTGAYAILDTLKLGLIGWSVGCEAQKKPAYFTGEQLLGSDDRYWSYLQTIAIPLEVEAGTPPFFVDPLVPVWGDLNQIEIRVGLFRSAFGAIGEPSSTKDSEIKVLVERE